MTLAEAGRSGSLVIEAKRIGKSFGDRGIVRDFSLSVARGDRIGIVGPNGSGKTTLLDMLTGASAPDEGSVKLAANLQVARLDQLRAGLDPRTRLADALTGGGTDNVTVGGEQRHVVSYLQDFLFTPEQARTPLHALSGGERGRLMLARAFAKPSNILVLDEPTNDLDLETLDVLQDRLGEYAGVVLIVSHDRDFLDRVVGAVIAPEGGGRWVEYAGGYTDMLAQRGEGFSPDPPTRARAREGHGCRLAQTRGQAREATLELQRDACARDLAEDDRGSRAPHPRVAREARGAWPLRTRPPRLRDHRQGVDAGASRARGRREQMARAGNLARAHSVTLIRRPFT